MAESAYAHLHEMLLTHRLPLDQPISERGLAADLGISRTPLREALRRLEGEGLLERLPGGVLRARRITVEEFLEIQQLRRLLEGEAAAAAAGAVEAETLASLRARIAALLATPDRPLPERQEERLAIDLDLHRAIAAAAGSVTLARLLEDLRRRMLLFTTPRAPDRLEEVCAQYGAIIDALAAGDREAARAAMAEHVDALRSGILRHLARL
nr:GntR family transcriptional regulator [Pararoseomonas indoligenes]